MLLNIFKQFFLLGCISFGGPVAHLGYFKKRFVDELKWLNDEDYSQIVALSQFLPGPGSSQTGFAIGYKLSGITGGILAFIAFTSPSVVLMLLLAGFANQVNDISVYQGVVHGLKLLAVVVVADATLGMFRNFCQQKLTQFLCLFTAIGCLTFPSLLTQMALLLLCAITSLTLSTNESTQPATTPPAKSKPRMAALTLFAVLLLMLPLLAKVSHEFMLANTFYTAGSLVFGGGHVVLPMLQNMLSESISSEVFLSGYAAAQAIPGPMFTLATWLGFHWSPEAPLLNAMIATLMIFLPGFLLVAGLLDAWQSLAHNPKLRGVMMGVNASVTGLLMSALYQPVFTSAVQGTLDVILLMAGFWLLKSLKLPILAVVGFFMIAGGLLLA